MFICYNFIALIYVQSLFYLIFLCFSFPLSFFPFSLHLFVFSCQISHLFCHQTFPCSFYLLSFFLFSFLLLFFSLWNISHLFHWTLIWHVKCHSSFLFYFFLFPHLCFWVSLFLNFGSSSFLQSHRILLGFLAILKSFKNNH